MCIQPYVKRNEIIKKKRSDIFFIFYGKLCNDVIKHILDIVYPTNNLNDLDNICENIKQLFPNNYFRKYNNYYLKSWICDISNISLWYNVIDGFKDEKYLKNNIIGKKKLHFNTQPSNLFLNDNHEKTCGCDICLFNLDYPRYIYLYKKNKNKIQGHLSKKLNQWVLFQYYLVSIQGVNNIIDTRYDAVDGRCGFTSVYNRVNNYQKRYNYGKSHSILKDNKNKWIQLEKIWENCNND